MMPNGGIFGSLMQMSGAGAAPAVPGDGAMQPTIGPGMPTAPAATGYRPKMGLPSGGLLGLMQGGNPQGLMGLLQNLTAAKPGAPPVAPAGMLGGGGPLPGMPGGPAGPSAQDLGLPTNISPMNLFG